jgi:uncharacterized repeat protein (TIGR03803 family)
MRTGLKSALAFGVLALAAPQSASAYTHNVLYSFCAETNCTDGDEPSGALVRDAAGNLYGVTATGGALGTDGFRDGTVYKLTPNAAHTQWTERVLYSFCRLANCTDGNGPRGALVLGADGSLYGMTAYGGSDHFFGGSGVVFKLRFKNGVWKYSVLHRFCTKDNCPDGESPNNGLSYAGAITGAPYDGTSPLYGTTESGGKFNGTMFEIVPDQTTGAWRESVLYSFCNGSGCHPQLDGWPHSSVTIGADGTFYGSVDENDAPGNIYSLLPSTDGKHWTERTEHTFCAKPHCAEGEHPLSDPLALDGQGSLYGTTYFDDVNFGGTLFEISLATRHLTVLHHFCSLPNCTDGSAPTAGLLRNSSGDLFGVTSQGGANNGGVLFTFHDGAYQVLYNFCSETNCADGGDPESALIEDGSGVMYGVTMSGGAHGGGTIYEVVP